MSKPNLWTHIKLGCWASLDGEFNYWLAKIELGEKSLLHFYKVFDSIKSETLSRELIKKFRSASVV